MFLGERCDEPCFAITQQNARVATICVRDVSKLVEERKRDVPAMSDCKCELVGCPVRL